MAQQPNRASPAAATELTPQKRPRTSGGGKAASQKKVVCQSVLEAHGLEAKVLVDITGWCVDLSEAKDIPGSRGVRKVMTIDLGRWTGCDYGKPVVADGGEDSGAAGQCV